MATLYVLVAIVWNAPAFDQRIAEELLHDGQHVATVATSCGRLVVREFQRDRSLESHAVQLGFDLLLESALDVVAYDVVPVPIIVKI